MFVHTDADLGEEDEAAEIAHDEQRWKLADTDGDSKLNKEEFSNFLHPEDVPHMRDSLIQVFVKDSWNVSAQFLCRLNIRCNYLVENAVFHFA